MSTTMQLADLAQPLEAEWIGENVQFETASIDSRTISPGELFIAIPGPHFDGHNYVQDALNKGAVAALVQRKVPVSIPQLIVHDVTHAMGQLAAIRRNQLHIPILAVTGSCGKTTTKTMMSSILSHCGAVHAGNRSHNNHFGLPITILGITQEHEYAVLEMGANHPNEIAYLTQIARPTVAGITIAAPVHLEGFINLEGVARGKGEIFQGLTDDGVAFINLDDSHADYWRSLVPHHRVITFGFSPQAEIRAEQVEMDDQSQPSFRLITPMGETTIKLPLLGIHNVTNALAATAATYAVGASLQAVKLGLETVTPVSKRMVKRIGVGGIEILDDSYNANPVGVEAALKVLAQGEGRKIFVMGEMAELGTFAERYHRQLAEKAQKYGVQQLYALGNLARYTVEEFGAGAYHFPDHEKLIAKLREDLQHDFQPNIKILVKGSRSMQMEKVVAALLEDVTNNVIMAG